MAAKSDFSPDEWKLLMESVMLAGISVTAADPSGLWGTLKESFATAASLRQAKGSGDPLLAAMVSDFETAEGRAAVQDALKQRLAGSKPAEIKDKAIEGLRQAVALIDRKGGNDASAFRALVRDTARRSAEASTEGGFLGFGGVQVSEAEKATLAQIDAALGGSGPGTATT